MKLSFMLIVSLLTALAFGQNQNWNGNGDTSQVNGFQGTGTVVSKKMRLSAFENSVFECYATDTGTAGAITGQSVKLIWGIEYCHPTWQSTELSPKYKYWGRVTIDTMDLSTAGNFIYTVPVMDSNGYMPITKKYVDTTTISRWACQSRPFSPFWDVYFRFWATGLSGNQASTYVKLIFQQQRRKAMKVNAE
jgi:hypothetical protein